MLAREEQTNLFYWYFCYLDTNQVYTVTYCLKEKAIWPYGTPNSDMTRALAFPILLTAHCINESIRAVM